MLYNIEYHSKIDEASVIITNSLSSIVKKISDSKEKKLFPLLNSPYETDDLIEIIELSEEIREKFTNVVVLGTGGSSINGQALANLSDNFSLGKVKLDFINNIDPYSFSRFLSQITLENTAFLCISKSGSMPETLAQFLITIKYYQDNLALNYNFAQHFFIITSPESNPLRTIGINIKARILNHSSIGGRFSALTNVGLLPAAILGLSPKLFRQGACQAIDSLMYNDCSEIVKGAALNFSLLKKGYNIHVIMPYVERLSALASWYRQLSAESLGKDGKGITTIKAMGTIDQHSQLQLYLGGPKDKFFTLINLATREQGPKIEANFSCNDIDYMLEKNLGDLIYAEKQATVSSLIKHDCPLRVIDLPRLDESILGELMMHFTLEIIIIAELMQVNAFDQPLVDEGKIIARNILKNYRSM